MAVMEKALGKQIVDALAKALMIVGLILLAFLRATFSLERKARSS